MDDKENVLYGETGSSTWRPGMEAHPGARRIPPWRIRAAGPRWTRRAAPSSPRALHQLRRLRGALFPALLGRARRPQEAPLRDQCPILCRGSPRLLQSLPLEVLARQASVARAGFARIRQAQRNLWAEHHALFFLPLPLRPPLPRLLRGPGSGVGLRIPASRLRGHAGRPLWIRDSGKTFGQGALGGARRRICGAGIVLCLPGPSAGAVRRGF